MSDIAKQVFLFHVPLNHRGSTGLLLKEAAGDVRWPDYSGILYIAPTANKARDAQKRFHSLVKTPYIPPCFFTLKQLSKHLFNIELPGKALPQKLVPAIISGISGHSIGYSVSLSNLMKELKQYHPTKDIPSIRHDLSEIFNKLGIPAEASKRLDSALDIFEEYQKLLVSNNYFDEDDMLNMGQDLVRHSLDKFSVLIADGFYDMTTSEKGILKELISKADKTLISVPSDDHAPVSGSLAEDIKSIYAVKEKRFAQGPENDLSFVKYSGIEEEVEGIARHIKNLYISGRLKSVDPVIVTFPDIRSYADLAGRVFRKYGLPCNTAYVKPAYLKPAIRDVLYLLGSIADDFPRAKFTTVLTSPHFKSIPSEIRECMPSLSIRAGIVKNRASWEKLNINKTDSVQQDISAIFTVLDTLIKTKNSADTYALKTEINKVLTELRYEAEDEDLEILNDALETISLLSEILELKKISLRKFTDILTHLLSTADYKQNDEAIQIMDFLETRGLEPHYLYLCGLKDGDMPSKPPIDHILPDSARKEYGLISLEKYLAVQKLNFLRISGSSSNIHLSYPSVDGDKLYLPSPYLPWGSEIPEKVFGVFSEEEKQTRQGKGDFADTIDEIIPDKKTTHRLMKDQLSMPLRVTDIDYFRKCRRRYFIEKLLKLEASEIAEYEIDARTLGTIIHSFMERLIKEPLDMMSNKAPFLLENILKDFQVDPYWKRLIKESFLEMLPDIIELENDLREDGFSPIEAEKSVKGEVLPGISLKGKIDRVDACDDTYRILDYKTGTVSVGPETIKKGNELQLPLYAAILKTKGMKIEKAGIYSLKDLKIKWIPTKRDKNTLDDYISGSLKFLKETVGEMNEGKFYARPFQDFHCLSCAESPFCPYINSPNSEQGEKR